MTGWRLGRRPALDGLRGVAVLLVVVSHIGAMTGASYASMHALGSAGVSMFFALSGFLITSLLLEEHADRGRVSLRRFYARRARRLFPALVALLIGVVVVMAVARVWLAPTLLPSVLYFANWYQVGGVKLGALAPTWSLSIEEQFYIVWPLLLLVALRRSWNLIPLLTVGIAASTALRLVLGGDRAYYGTDTQASTLLLGALLAVLAPRGLRAVKPARWVVVGVTLAPALSVFGQSKDIGDVWVPTVVPVVACVAIWVVCCTPATGVLASAPLRYVGRRSYALYLWHLPLLWVARAEGWSPLLAVAATACVAELSWRLVESPFLRRRSGHSGDAAHELETRDVLGARAVGA